MVYSLSGSSTNMPNVSNSDLISYNEAVTNLLNTKNDNKPNQKVDEKPPSYQEICKLTKKITVLERSTS